MKSIQKENIEYDKFVIELAHKVQEIRQDLRAITAKGIVGVSEYFNQWK